MKLIIIIKLTALQKPIVINLIPFYIKKIMLL